ncbi:O-antigen ligase family protein [Maribacter sp. 2307ULW6-5]|uniref:O-antigen ligase family protein n=1 Tax=Maribacter sp. 2307ULW6-5 TaxID=3386275 RepID=UPI0039BC9269
MNTGTNHINPFDKLCGSAGLASGTAILGVLLATVALAFLLVKMKVAGAVLLLALFFGGIYAYALFKHPILGFYSAIVLNFVILGSTRYVKFPFPVGFVMDGILVLSFLALIFSRFRERVDWSPAGKPVTFLAVLWLGYFIFQLMNPEARSTEAWIAGRSTGFHFLFVVVLTLMFMDSNKRLDTFLYIWGVFSILASFKGMGQLFFGVDAAEQAWLDGGAAQTHVLFGKLRIFGFYTDAGNYGANQGYSAVVALIYAMTKKGRAKIFFITVGVLGLYGMLISGTRGAIAVPFIGFMTFFVLRKNIKVLTAGVLFVALVFVFFKFTTIGNGNDQIRRMRTGFDPNNPSLMVRKKNQAILKTYLASRPFGGGVGHGGDKAQRFLPHAFLSHVATDSWYVMIWVEMGIVGLVLHLIILFYVIGTASFKVMFRIRDPITKLRMSALIAGMAGVMVASYGNEVLGQMPNSLLIYATMAIISVPEIFERPKEDYLPKPIEK